MLRRAPANPRVRAATNPQTPQGEKGRVNEMLVLTRRTNETIEIGNDVRITVCRVDGGQVRLGIDAPRTTRILRGELAPPPPQADADTLPCAA
jgi:carbon storage regulator